MTRNDKILLPFVMKRIVHTSISFREYFYHSEPPRKPYAAALYTGSLLPVINIYLSTEGDIATATPESLTKVKEIVYVYGVTNVSVQFLYLQYGKKYNLFDSHNSYIIYGDGTIEGGLL